MPHEEDTNVPSKSKMITLIISFPGNRKIRLHRILNAEALAKFTPASQRRLLLSQTFGLKLAFHCGSTENSASPRAAESWFGATSKRIGPERPAFRKLSASGGRRITDAQQPQGRSGSLSARRAATTANTSGPALAPVRNNRASGGGCFPGGVLKVGGG